MFLEVYAVKRSEYTEANGVSQVPENRRLIEMTGARVRVSSLFPDRAEIVLPTKSTFLAAGSYEDIVQRLVEASTSNVSVARLAEYQ